MSISRRLCCWSWQLPSLLNCQQTTKLSKLSWIWTWAWQDLSLLLPQSPNSSDNAQNTTMWLAAYAKSWSKGQTSDNCEHNARSLILLRNQGTRDNGRQRIKPSQTLWSTLSMIKCPCIIHGLAAVSLKMTRVNIGHKSSLINSSPSFENWVKLGLDNSRSFIIMFPPSAATWPRVWWAWPPGLPWCPWPVVTPSPVASVLFRPPLNPHTRGHDEHPGMGNSHKQETIK